MYYTGKNGNCKYTFTEVLQYAKFILGAGSGDSGYSLVLPLFYAVGAAGAAQRGGHAARPVKKYCFVGVAYHQLLFPDYGTAAKNVPL